MILEHLKNVDFGGQVGFSLGLEAEFILPFNNNKWALTFEPTYYQSFKAEKQLNTVAGNVKIDYKSFEVPLGIRHYFFLNSSKLFINASYLINFSSNSIIDYENADDLKILAGNNFALGVGYKYNRYSLEVKFASSRELLGGTSWQSDYRRVSLIFGYEIF